MAAPRTQVTCTFALAALRLRETPEARIELTPAMDG
jgi:hypothetical protein